MPIDPPCPVRLFAGAAAVTAVPALLLAAAASALAGADRRACAAG